ncbi:MAG: O-antigen ligase family protein [Richelia sp. RM2_1_2]|nr:O-antigen ligase family protein [Richelia sp. SM1_7_0]NJN09065.1 O-antigen ligase family protein [Richelia sp. RM1_1_1]NJO58598.1 O-antigen ligase family protein [Richelia sp. RM2_1_2]
MPKLPKLTEKIFVVFTLFLSTSALIPVLIEGGGSGGISSDPYSPKFFTVIYTITFLLITVHQKNFVRVAQKDIWIWLFLGIVIASILWTFAPDVTPRRSGLLLGTSLFAVYMAMRFTLREQLQLLAVALGIVIVFSFIFAIALPKYGLMTVQEGGIHAGAWRGIMTHKNILGRLMVFSSMVFLFVAMSNPIRNIKYRWIPWAGYILSIALIVLSTSKSSLVVFLSLTVILFLYRSWRSNYNQLIPLIIALILTVGSISTLLLDNLPVVADALGRDLTLTGRTNIWSAMFDLIRERPWLGYGFNAVWRDWNSEITAYLWRTLAWQCPYGHNGFMDLFIELGIAGLSVFLLSFITTYFRGVMWLRITKCIEGIWPLIYLTFLVMYNISESTLVETNSIFWIVYVSTVFSLAIEYPLAKNDQYNSSSLIEEKWINMKTFPENN